MLCSFFLYVSAITQFKALLMFCFNSRATFSDFAQKHGKDPKFKAIEKMREREHLFNEWRAEQQAEKKKDGDESVKEESSRERKESRDRRESRDRKESRERSKDRSRDRHESRDRQSRDRRDSKESKARQVMIIFDGRLQLSLRNFNVTVNVWRGDSNINGLK